MSKALSGARTHFWEWKEKHRGTHTKERGHLQAEHFREFIEMVILSSDQNESRDFFYQ